MADSVQVKKVSNWMEALSDYMIANPDASARDAAVFFDKSQSWVSITKNSDSFIAFHKARREQHFERVSTSVGEKLTALSETALDTIQEKLEINRDDLPMNQLIDLNKMALGAMGFGAGRGGHNVNVSVEVDNKKTIVVSDRAALDRARQVLAERRQENDKLLCEQRVGEMDLESPETEEAKVVNA